MTILELRQTVTALLGDLLGNYTLPNGSKQMALWVDGKNGVPKGWKVQGMEASIRQYPARTSRPLMATVEVRKTWEVVLSQYDPGSEVMDEAVERMLRHFPDAALRGFPASDREYQYARFVIPDLEIKLQYKRAE